jgi:intein/homing endonuclease
MDDWRAGQGQRAAKGIPELMRALEFIARQVADGQSWSADPQPVSLTRKQVKTAWHRAISQRRRAEYGPPGKSPDEWWEQISSIAARWGIETNRAEWEQTSKVRPAKPASSCS